MEPIAEYRRSIAAIKHSDATADMEPIAEYLPCEQTFEVYGSGSGSGSGSGYGVIVLDCNIRGGHETHHYVQENGSELWWNRCEAGSPK